MLPLNPPLAVPRPLRLCPQKPLPAACLRPPPALHLLAMSVMSRLVIEVSLRWNKVGDQHFTSQAFRVGTSTKGQSDKGLSNAQLISRTSSRSCCTSALGPQSLPTAALWPENCIWAESQTQRRSKRKHATTGSRIYID